ncbi:MAG: hypothetical protein KatS3mg131_0961 [Candidatus Tectimicrobiota bacterium]|nr:MAG: hypothetical protein KatS3mg131_0961 [Candidatus Tectomicrobia bacterium]
MKAAKQSAAPLGDWRLSPTVGAVRDGLADAGPVNAVVVAKAILERHPEYAKGTLGPDALHEGEPDTDRRPVDAWLAAVQELYNSETVPELHGRLVVIGLGLLSPSLREQLQQDNFWDALIGELREPLESLLSEQGRALLEPPDAVPTHPDQPLDRLEQDRLGRAAFARFLARRIAAVSEEEGSYAIHLYGPWGAGKSTVLRFLAQALAEADGARDGHGNATPGRWRVVEFNAWRHQHVHPPWWALLDAVFRRTQHRLSLWERACEYGWRFSAGRGVWLASLAILIAVAWLLVLVVLPWARAESAQTLPAEPAQTLPLAVLEVAGQLGALAVTLWGIASAVGRSLLVGSAEAARSYLSATRNPMETIKGRFTRLIDRLKPDRVAIFIDDLDRCRSAYVVELLEGIQTLFRDAPVVYVVAADRRWLNACYEEVYQSMRPWVHVPGKSLGTLFLEKLFQLSTPVPAAPPRIQEAYWHHLIGVRADAQEPTEETIEHDEREGINETDDEAALLRRLHEVQDPGRSQAIRERIVARLAEPEVVARTEHALKPFAPLLEPTPRAMKRLVNAYSTNRALALLSHLDIDREPLVRWTILSLRWPRLADALAEHPEWMERKEEAGAAVPAEIEALLGREVVQAVLDSGHGARKPLDAETIRLCATLRA